MHLTHALASLAAISSFAVGVNAAFAHGAVDPSARQPVREAAADVAQTLTGTVNAFDVVDTTRGTSQRHVELRLDDDTFVPLQGRAVDALAQDARVEVSGHRRGKPLDVESVRTLSLAPSTGNKATSEVDGTLAILHADYFVDEKSAFIYEVHDASGKVRRLQMGALPAVLEPGTVAEGRDIGTVIFPDADLKIFLDADAGERTRRRTRELAERSASPEAIARVGEEMAERDRRDSTRTVAPLAKADDAVVMDTTLLSFDEVVAHIVREVEIRRRSPK